MTQQTEYLKNLVADLKRYKKANNEVNKRCNELSQCHADELASFRALWEDAKNERDALCNELGDDRVDEIERLSNRNKRRWMRVRSAVRAMLQFGNVCLVTLTFDDVTLFSTSELTRRTYVRKYLSSQSERYFANRDFGKKNGREHYHALVVGEVDFKKWTHGTVNSKRVKVPKDGEKEAVSRISKYIDKITNHALKDTACDRIIWSRSFSQKELPEEEELLDSRELNKEYYDTLDALAWLDELGG